MNSDFQGLAEDSRFEAEQEWQACSSISPASLNTQSIPSYSSTWILSIVLKQMDMQMGNTAGNGKKSLPSKEVSVSTAYHVQNEKALVLLKVPTFSLLRLHLPPTSPRAGPLPLLPKPDKLRSTRGQQKLPGNRDWSWKKAGNTCVLQGLRRKTGLPDNVRIWQTGRRLLKSSWNRKTGDSCSHTLLPEDLWKSFPPTRKILNLLETLRGFTLLASLEFSLDPSFSSIKSLPTAILIIRNATRDGCLELFRIWS